MATDVPGVVHIGDANIQGGGTGSTSLNNAYYLDLNDVINTPKTDFTYSSDRDAFHITPHSLSNGNSMSVASGAHIWYDEIYMSGALPHKVQSFTTTSITLTSAVLTSGVHATKRLTFIDDAGGVVGVFSGLTIAAQKTITGNTDQVVFFASGGYSPHVAQGVWVPTGGFTDYHPCAGYLHTNEIVGGIARRGGSSVAQGNHGVGPDAYYIPDFFEKVWNVAPYFHAFKYVSTVTITDGWSDSGTTQRAGFLAKVAEVEAAAALRGNTIKWELAIIDLSMTALRTGNAAYIATEENATEEMIAWLRTTALNNASLKVIIVNHRDDMWNVTGSSFGVLGAPFYRTLNKNVVRDVANVGLVDMQDQPIANSGDSPNVSSSERKYYSQDGYRFMGKEIVRVYQRLALGTATEQSGGFPVYMYFGDSIAVGQITADWTTNSLHEELTGPTVGDLTRPSNQLIYVRGTGILEVYKPHTNSNPEGHANTTASHDLSMMAELGKHHPDGFALIKRGSSGSSLAASLGNFSGVAGYEVAGRWHQDYSEHWPELINAYAGAMQYINNTLGKQADLMAIFVSLGHNDQAAPGGAQLFVDKFGSFLTDLESQFGTETNPGRRTHVIWRRPQPDAASVTLSGMVLVRTAIEQRAASDPYFHFIDVDGQIRDHTDNLHESPEAAVNAGRMFVQAISGAWMAGL